MVTATSDRNIDSAINSYLNLSTDEKLALLWYVYTKIGTSVTPAAPGAASDAIAEGLFKQVAELPFEKQMGVQRKLIERQDTLISREYGALSENTKLCFWYRLAQGMEAGTIIPVPDNYQASGRVKELLSQIELMEFEQQITFLREVVAFAGAELKSDSGI